MPVTARLSQKFYERLCQGGTARRGLPCRDGVMVRGGGRQGRAAVCGTARGSRRPARRDDHAVTETYGAAHAEQLVCGIGLGPADLDHGRVPHAPFAARCPRRAGVLRDAHAGAVPQQEAVTRTAGFGAGCGGRDESEPGGAKAQRAWPIPSRPLGAHCQSGAAITGSTDPGHSAGCVPDQPHKRPHSPEPFRSRGATAKTVTRRNWPRQRGPHHHLPSCVTDPHGR